MVVSVVVKDRTEGAGEENVLSAPLVELMPPPIVVLVHPPDEAPCDRAATEWAASCSVGANDLLPMVGGGAPSSEDLKDLLLLLSDEMLPVLPVGTSE